jgi:hypothetical protein
VSSLGELLALVIDCDGVADWIGDRCVFGICVDDFVDTGDLGALCSDGLGLIGFLVEESIRGLRFDLVDLDGGRCEMYDVGYDDASGDFVIDALAGGEWDLSVSTFGQSYVIENSFEGRRIDP